VVPEIAAGRTAFGEDMVWEIVGVVAGEKSNGLGDETSAGLYVSYMQSPTYGHALLVRGDIAPQSLQSGIRQALDRVNRDQALSDVRTLDEIVNRSTLANRVVSLLFALFASLALLLAAVGIYGVISYTAAQRTHEMGVRAALGASASSLRALVFRGGMGLASIGLAAGLGGTFAAARVMSSMVYGVGATDPLTIGVVAGVLGAVAAVACFMPARRIAKINPIDVLRQA
jgi:putative ABC transport system permease protein